MKWVTVAAKNRLSYEVDWLGIPIIQTPEDIVLMQELIFKLKPDVIVETGIAHGGSLIYYSSLFELLGKGKVIGIDIDIREHNRKVIEKHPMFKRIELIEGDSVSKTMVEEIKKRIPDGAKVMVCLDSDHTKSHVAKELDLYHSFVTPGSYLVVFDTITSKMSELGVCDKSYLDNSPMEAVEDFLKKNKDFEIDKYFNKFFVSHSPNGFLRKKRN